MQLPLFKTRKRTYSHFPWFLFSILLVWIALGLINLYSATWIPQQEGLPLLFRSQLIWIGLGMLMLWTMTLFDYHQLQYLAYTIYFFSIILLLLVFVPAFGHTVAGQKNWISVAGFSLQPSEMAKPALILALARLYSSTPLDQKVSTGKLLLGLCLLLPPLILVVLQKDHGGSLFFVLIFITLAFFLKISAKFWIIGILLSLAGGGFANQYLLKGYQKDRIRIFLNPESDPKKAGYHLMQAKIAVGSGQVFGKGYLQGNINKLKYLPERHTDFIFPVLAEEWGLVGCTLALAVMGLFILWGFASAYQCRDSFGHLLAIGIVGLLFWQMLINLGGVLGLMPLTGVPLPLFSYGGSSVLTLMMAVGVFFNVLMRRFFF